MNNNYTKLKLLLATVVLLLGSNFTFAQWYVGPGTQYTILGDQTMWASLVTDRSANYGYIYAEGNSQLTNVSDDRNVNGYMRHVATAANQAYTFQVGTGAELRALTISGTIPANSTVTTAYIKGNPAATADPTNGGALHAVTSVGTGIKSVFTGGQWDWIDNSNNNAGATVTVSIPDVSSFTTDASKLRLVGWDGTKWINLSGSTGATGTAVNSTLSGTIPANTTTLQALAIGLASGVGVGVPDFTASVSASRTAFSSSARTANVVVTVTDILNNGADQPMSFRFQIPSGFDVSVPGITLSNTDQSGVSGTIQLPRKTVTHDNANFNFRVSGTSILITAKPGYVLPKATTGSPTINLGLVLTAKSTLTSVTQLTSSFAISGNAGGQTNTTNDIAVLNLSFD